MATSRIMAVWPAGDRAVRRADLQSRPGRARHRHAGTCAIAVEPVLARVVAGLDLDQADVEPGVAVRVEAERAGDVDRADRPVGRRRRR